MPGRTDGGAGARLGRSGLGREDRRLRRDGRRRAIHGFGGRDEASRIARIAAGSSMVPSSRRRPPQGRRIRLHASCYAAFVAEIDSRGDGLDP